ncbi:hypothetical protein AK812_SmicGene46109, partial [Symbiodinium microadriaticum]
MNGGGDHDRPAGDQGRDEAAPRSSREVTARPDSVHENGGGGENGGCDVFMEAEPQPAATTSALNQESSSAQTGGGTGEDPLLFQGSRPRTDITDQGSTSGGGPAGLGGLVPEQMSDDIRGNVFQQGVFQTPRIRPARSSASPDMVAQQQPSNLQGWIAKFSELFRAPAVSWLPSPMPSPPCQEDLQDNQGLVERLQHMEKENARLQDQLDQAKAEQLSREIAGSRDYYSDAGHLAFLGDVVVEGRFDVAQSVAKMGAEDVKHYHQHLQAELEALAEPEGEASPNSASAPNVVAGEPIWTLESLLQAAAKEEWEQADPVIANLAGGES